MIADVVEDSELKTGRRSEGHFLRCEFAQKAVNGLGVVVAGQILAFIQFPTQAKPGDVPAEVIFLDLAFFYVPVLMIFYLAALVGSVTIQDQPRESF